MLQSLPGMERCPIQQYIEDLQQSEAQAVQTARMNRKKFEREKCMKKVAVAAAAKKQLFLSNILEEQYTRTMFPWWQNG